jgi:hypothetical protein
VAFDRTSLILRMIGHFGTSGSDFKDRWSTGLRLASDTGIAVTDGPYTGFLAAIATPIATFHSNLNALVGTNCYLDELTCAKVGLDGKYASAEAVTTHHIYATPVSGTGTPTQAFNTALVHSLRTANLRGYASNGRVYYPCTAAIVSAATGRVVDGNVAGRLAPYKVSLDAINTQAAILQSGLTIVVMSSVGTGTAAKVTSVRADGRLDSIERRENNQPSTWSTVTLA